MKILDKDDFTGVTTLYEKDKMTGQSIIKTTQDTSAILDDNQRDLDVSSKSWSGDMHHVARIPINVINQWRQELKDDPLHPRNRRWLIAKINNLDFIKFRTKAGRI